MSEYYFATPTVSEAPFAWSPLMERYRMNRAESVLEVSPNVFEIGRYESYTDVLNYTGTGPGAPTVIQPNGLRYYQGGYNYIVSSTDMAQLIAGSSGAITSANFTLVT
jgi:hypothetical protein